VCPNGKEPIRPTRLLREQLKFEIFMSRVRPLRSQFTWMAEPPFKWRMAVCQLWLDLFSKEVATGFTYTYAWTADQIGHVTLGLIVSLMIRQAFLAIGRPWTLWDGGIVCVVGILAFAIKEGGDVRRCKRQAAESPFRECFRWGPVFANAATATGYVAAGLLLGRALDVGPRTSLAVFGATLVVGLAVAFFWLRLRYMFQQSGTPYVRRIWSVPGDLSKAHIEVVRSFLAGSHQHLVITGAPGTGKTTLAIALATELAALREYVRFLTWFQAQELASLNREPPVQEGAILWRWRKCTASVIDDVAVASNLKGSSPVSATTTIGPLEKILRGQRTVWVLPGDPVSSSGAITAIQRLLGLTEPPAVVELIQKLYQDIAPTRLAKPAIHEMV
jgi:hypothetical protein